MIQHWKKNRPRYYEKGVQKNTIEEMASPSMWFFRGKFKEEDLIYNWINSNFVVDFLNEQKILRSEKRQASFALMMTCDSTEMPLKMGQTSKMNNCHMNSIRTLFSI